jgi:hypothetical protein
MISLRNGIADSAKPPCPFQAPETNQDLQAFSDGDVGFSEMGGNLAGARRAAEVSNGADQLAVGRIFERWKRPALRSLSDARPVSSSMRWRSLAQPCPQGLEQQGDGFFGSAPFRARYRFNGFNEKVVGFGGSDAGIPEEVRNNCPILFDFSTETLIPGRIGFHLRRPPRPQPQAPG